MFNLSKIRFFFRLKKLLLIINYLFCLIKIKKSEIKN